MFDSLSAGTPLNSSLCLVGKACTLMGLQDGAESRPPQTTATPLPFSAASATGASPRGTRAACLSSWYQLDVDVHRCSACLWEDEL